MLKNTKKRPLLITFYCSLLFGCSYVIMNYILPEWYIGLLSALMGIEFLLMFGEDGENFVIRIMWHYFIPSVVLPLLFNCFLYRIQVPASAAFCITTAALVISELFKKYPTKKIKRKVINIRIVALFITLLLTLLSLNLNSWWMQIICIKLGITATMLKIAIAFVTPISQIIINFLLKIAKKELQSDDFLMFAGIAWLFFLLPFYVRFYEENLLVKLLPSLIVPLFKSGDILNNAKNIPCAFINGVFGEAMPSLTFSKEIPKKFVSKTWPDIFAIAEALAQGIISLLKEDKKTTKKQCYTLAVKFTQTIVTFHWKYFFTWTYKKKRQFLM